MDITRNGQTITFTTNPDSTEDADLVQTSDYLNSADLPIPVHNYVIGGMRIVASTGYLARQAMRELDAANANTDVPSTYHPGRCYCAVFAGSMHAPGLVQVGLYGSRCKGDRVAPHDASTCGACIAGALDYRPTIEAGQIWVSNSHATDHEVYGEADEPGTWAMWGPVGNLYVISAERLYTAYTLDLDRSPATAG